jgi:hypothetical protein
MSRYQSIRPEVQGGRLLGVGDGEGRFFLFSPSKIAQDEGEGAARDSR